MKTVRPVKVVWVDSLCAGGWVSDEAARLAQPSTITSVGFLLERDRKRVVIAQSVPDEVGEVGDVLAIPAAAVQSLQPLEMP